MVRLALIVQTIAVRYIFYLYTCLFLCYCMNDIFESIADGIGSWDGTACTKISGAIKLHVFRAQAKRGMHHALVTRTKM